MKLRIGDFYYGAALAQIAGYPVLTHVHGVDGKEGYFQINDNKRLLIKYATTGNGTWRFTVRPEDLAVLSDRADYEIWFALVCGESTICLLDEDQLQSVVDIESSTSQWISVTFEEGSSMRVAGSVCALKHRVRHNAFPHDLLLPEGIEPKGFSWPPLCRLQFYSTWPGIARTTENPSFDLADALAWNIVGRDKKTVYMSLRTFSPDWQVWDDKTLTRVEGAIEYDLNFDGFKVAIERLSPRVFNHGRRRVAPPCSSEFMWKLTISVMR